MAKMNMDLALKILGGACTVAGTVIGLISTNKENAKNVEAAVEKILKEQNK